MKGGSAGGNLLAKMLPTFEKYLFKILGIREESLARLLLLSGTFNLATDLHFLLQRFKNFIYALPCFFHIF